MHLLDLPVEIIIAVLAQTHPKSLSSTLKTCRKLHKIINESTLLNYIIEQEIAGILDNPYSSLSLSSRLELLRRRENAWATFKYDFITRAKVPKRCSGVYDITPGVYMVGRASETEEFVTSAIQSVRLPSAKPTNEEHGLKWWEIEAGKGKEIIDFGTAIEEHDLAALVTSVSENDFHTTVNVMEVVLVRYSTGKPHDEARQPILRMCRSDISEGPPSASIEIVGENLIVVLSYSTPMAASVTGDHIYVFDWKAGREKSVPLEVNNAGTVFLREDFFINPDIGRETINIYHIPQSNSTTASIRPVRVVLSLFLPEIAAGQHITYISCRSDPNPISLSTFPRFPPYTPSSRPIANDPAEAIIIFMLHIQPAARSYVMIVHRKALLEYALKALEEEMQNDIFQDYDQISQVLSWLDWGPSVTRWFNADKFSTGLITATAGQRYVYLVGRPHILTEEQVGGWGGEGKIHILDFNPWHVKMAKARRMIEDGPRGKDTGSQAVEEFVDESTDTICLGYDALEEDVESTLPYVRCISEEVFNMYDAVLVDEERIIGTSESNPDVFRIENLNIMHFG
ncbi:hypothetical protein B0H34DRAFT_126378 [Crassisporium funariophilum]|nr:hypothetical protein B0H34DRAFT_126378 [Crassisporium funariophilum]